MKISHAAACIAVSTLAQIAFAQDKPVCPHGQVGDWAWRADSMRFVVVNPTLQLNWETLGGEVATAGLEIDVASLNSPDAVSSVYVRMTPPAFMFKPENAAEDAKPNLFFGSFGARFEPDAPAPEAYPMQHDYTLMLTDEIGGEEKLLFSGRYEQWDQGDRRIVGGWLGAGPEGIGWRIVDVEKMRVVAATRYYRGQAQGQTPGNDNIARTQLIDLGDMDPVWKAARAGHAGERARAKATNLSCTWAAPPS
jgi:hypothetical protein